MDPFDGFSAGSGFSGLESASQLYADLGGSVVGVFASTFLVLERDVHVHLVISFPDRKSIRAAGVVQFVRPAGPEQLPGLGVAFTEIAADDRGLVKGFAERVRPRAHPQHALRACAGVARG